MATAGTTAYAPSQPQYLPSNPTSADWIYFRERFSDFLCLTDMTSASEDKKKSLLLLVIGREGTDILEGLPEPKSTYTECLKQFNDYFGSKSSTLLRRKVFFSAKQEYKESATAFACRLRRLSADCNFGTNRNNLLRDIFVIGIYDDRLGEKLLAEDETVLTFDLAIRKAEAFDRARQERAAASTKSSSLATMNSYNPKSHKSKPNYSQQKSASNTEYIQPKSSYKRYNTSKTPNQKTICYRCGSPRHLASAPTCPAIHYKCTCGKVGHYPSVCRSRLQQNRKMHVRGIDAKSTSDDESLKDFTIFAMGPSFETKRNVFINDTPVEVMVDTGAEVCVLPSWVQIPIDLKPTSARIQVWGKFDIPTIGETVCTVKYKNKEVTCKFIVVKNEVNSIPLLSLSVSRKLGMMDELTQTQINSVNFLDEYKDLFNGIGRLNIDYCYKPTITPDAIPKHFPARRLPPALTDQVKAELDNLLKQGIIKQISEPTPWCSSMMVVRKKSGNIRLVVDFRHLNKYIQRQHYQIPRLDDMLPLLANSYIYSTLDATSGYHQIPVHNESQHLFTFSTPFGRYCYQRLPFGINTASEIYQQIMNNVLDGINGVICYQDDVLVYGKNKSEHDQRLKEVLNRLKSVGLKLNKSKCKFGENKIEFLGHTISSEGISPSLDKVSALSTMNRPETKDALRSFLGMASYLGQRYVPHYSSLCKPLWSLLSLPTFSWNEEASNAFYKVRNALSKPVTLAFFNYNQPITLAVDASPTGLGATIHQNGKLVACGSRKLSDTESRYSQIEREFLAIVFGIHRFRSLLIGQKFEVTTDHKPLLSFFNKSIDNLPLRIQRWMLAVQSYDFHLRFISGKDNLTADGFSRNPIKYNTFAEEQAEYTVCFILSQSPMDLKQVAEESMSDPFCKRLYNAIKNGWTKNEKHAFPDIYPYRSDFSLKECKGYHIILRNSRIFIPTLLRQPLLKQIHGSHLGLQKMKENLRSFAWWPNANSEIEEFVKRCPSCTKYQTNSTRAPISEINTARPFEKFAIDLTGPSGIFDGHIVLTGIDYYSRYPFAFILNSGNSKEVIWHLRSIFSLFGLPECIISDNGSCFTSKEIETFFSSLGIKHSLSSVYFPSSNGLIERFHKTLKSRLARVREDKRISLQCALDRVLYDIRSSISPKYGKTPFFRLFGRPMRTEISLIKSEANPKSKSRNYEKQYGDVNIRRNAKLINYKCGQNVMARKGKGSKFDLPGVIVANAGKGSWRIRTPQGIRTYNQFNLIPIKYSTESDQNYVDEEAEDAYENVQAGVVPEPTADVLSHQYNLRPRKNIKRPNFYMP